MDYYLSVHAAERARSMEIDADTIQALVDRPETTRPNNRGSSRLHQRGDFVAVCETRPDYVLVLTFLWAKPELWAAHAAPERPFDPAKWNRPDQRRRR